MDEKELEAVSEALEELRKGGTVSAETLEKLGGTTQSANKALAGYTQKLLGVTGAMGGMAKTVAEGEGSFKSLGSSITGLTGVIGNLASAIPLVGGAAKALAEGVGQAAKFVLEQLDTMAQNYQTLGDASAGAADGVDGLLRQFNQLGNYSLPAFTKAVKNNTLGLAAFQGTAAAGAEELSKVSGALTTGDTAKRFLKLGMSLNAVGDATASYLADSARYGITQGQTTEELTKKTQNYIEEVDKIARLTGQTREAQQKEAQKSLADAKFRAKLAEMTANGQEQQAEELRKYVEGLGGAAGDAARALVTGIPLTKDAANANLFAGDAIRQNTLAIQEGKKATTAIADTQQALADGTVKFSKQVQYSGDIFGGVYVQAADTAAILKEQNKLMESGMTREQAIAKIQEKQAKASGKTTEQFTDAQLATAAASKNLQSLGFTLAENAIPAVDAFASGLQKVTGFIDEKFGSGKKGGAGGETGGTLSWWNKMKNAVGLGPGVPETNKILETIKKRESGGDYQAQAKGSTASGAYQFIDSTWQALTKKAGIGTEYKSAKLAPKEIQDQIAETYVNDILKQAGGDVSKVPLAWYTGNIQGKISDKALAANNGLTPEMYQQKWMADYAKTAGTTAKPNEQQARAKNTEAPTTKPKETQLDTQTASNVAGPTTKYRSNLAGDPSATMPQSQQQPTQTADTTTSDSRAMEKNLAELVALQRQSIALQAKILQQAKAS